MKKLISLISRNVKLFFKDKTMFFTSLITPMILLILYATFLGKIFKDSFTSSVPEGIVVDGKILDGIVGGQLTASILAVSCVTVAFCSNFLMVQDKAKGTIRDLTITPLRPSILALGYYISSVISTLIVCFSAALLCFIYMGISGWFMSFSDVAMLLLDVVILVLFGTAISSIINMFLKTEGQMSAVGSIVSSVYGFVCGAYMPISSFGTGLQKILLFLPGTYGTSIIKEHALRGAMNELATTQHFPTEVIEKIKDSLDYNVYFFDNLVPLGGKIGIVVITVSILITIYVILNIFIKKRDK